MSPMLRDEPLKGRALEDLEARMRGEGRTSIADPKSGDVYGDCGECGEFADLHEGFCRPCFEEWEGEGE